MYDPTYGQTECSGSSAQTDHWPLISFELITVLQLQAFFPGMERKVNGLCNMLWPFFALIYQTLCRRSVLMRGQKQLLGDETLNIGAQSCWQGKVDGKFVPLFPNGRSSFPSSSNQSFIIHLLHFFFSVKGICQCFTYNLKWVCELSNFHKISSMDRPNMWYFQRF